MPLMNFDLEDGLPPVSFTLREADAERFMAFMAECHAAKQSGNQPTDERKDAERWDAFRWLGASGADVEEFMAPILERIFPTNDERLPRTDEIDALGDAVIEARARALAQQSGKEQDNG